MTKAQQWFLMRRRRKRIVREQLTPGSMVVEDYGDLAAAGATDDYGDLTAASAQEDWNWA